MKKFLAALGIIASIAASFLIGKLSAPSADLAWDEGFDAGFENGWAVGIKSSDSYDYWLETSFEEQIKDAFNAGQTDAITAGFLLGYNAGYDDRDGHVERVFTEEDLDAYLADGTDPFATPEPTATPKPTPRPTATPKPTPKPTATPTPIS